MGILIEVRGPKTGQCNICGELGQLTEDHTPPKGCIRVGQVEIRHIVHRLSAEMPQSSGRKSQNGVKYRTLCPRCNNGLLGANYDIAFNSFVNSVGAYLKSPLELPDVVSVKAQPQKIMRAVLGHMSAQGINRYLKGPETESVRNYFLDEALPLPDSLNIYYWVYPYQGQVLVRDCSYLDLSIGEPVFMWFMKFFPVAFMITWKEPSAYNFTVPNLSKWRTSAINDEYELVIPLKRVVHQFWPEAPTNQSIVAYGQEAVIAVDLPKRKS